MNVDDFEIILYEGPQGYDALVSYCGDFIGSRTDEDPLVAQYSALCAIEEYIAAQRKALKSTGKKIKAAQEYVAAKYDGTQERRIL